MTLSDKQPLVSDLVRTTRGEFDLDGRVDAADYATWRSGLSGGVADSDFVCDNDQEDYRLWRAACGSTCVPLTLFNPTVATNAAPSASAASLLELLLGSA